jgi:hypothetical protein
MIDLWMIFIQRPSCQETICQQRFPFRITYRPPAKSRLRMDLRYFEHCEGDCQAGTGRGRPEKTSSQRNATKQARRPRPRLRDAIPDRGQGILHR